MFYAFAKVVVGTLVRLIWNPTITGEERIPRKGPVILASNHVSYADTVVMPMQVSRAVHFLGKSDIFKGGSPLNQVFALVLRGLHVMPVDRSGGAASRSAIEGGLTVLGEGKVLGIYPEGSRSPDGRLHRFKTGTARFALATGAPVVPVAMVDTFEAHRGRKMFPHRRPQMRVVMGEPIDVAALAEAFEGLEEGRLLRAVTEVIRERVQELSGQEYVDEYASDVKRRLRAEADRPT